MCINVKMLVYRPQMLGVLFCRPTINSESASIYSVVVIESGLLASYISIFMLV